VLSSIEVSATRTKQYDVRLYHIEKLKRKVEYISRKIVTKNSDCIDCYKVFIPGAGGSGNDPYVLGVPEFAPPNSVCSQSYLFAKFDTETETHNFITYLKTKFFRVLVSAMKISQSAPQRTYRFVPIQDFTDKSDINWQKSVADIDKQLYKKYNLTANEVEFIETHIKPMNVNGAEITNFGEGVFHTTRRGIVARMKVTEDGKYVVLAGSEIDLDHPLDKHQGKANRMREDCLKGKGFKQEGKKYILQKDMVFDSASTASGFVLGGSTNGFAEWKDDDGRTLDEVKR